MIMGLDPFYLKPYDGSVGTLARSNLLKQLKEASPEKTDAELAEQIDEMVERALAGVEGIIVK